MESFREVIFGNRARLFMCVSRHVWYVKESETENKCAHYFGHLTKNVLINPLPLMQG